MLKCKFDFLEALSKAGYSSYRLRKEKLIGQRTIQELREGKVPGIMTIETICRLLGCQPGDLIEYIKEE